MFLDGWFKETFGLSSVIRYRIPFYQKNKYICYLNPRHNGVEIGFSKGYKIPIEHPLFLAKGRSIVKSVMVTSLDDLPVDVINTLMVAALRIDKTAIKQF